jgi:hypothetical protein
MLSSNLYSMMTNRRGDPRRHFDPSNSVHPDRKTAPQDTERGDGIPWIKALTVR